EDLILCGTNDGILRLIKRNDGFIACLNQIYNSSIPSIIEESSEVITCSLARRICLSHICHSQTDFIETIYQSESGLSTISYLSNSEYLLIGTTQGEIIALARKYHWQKVVYKRISYESITDLYSFGNGRFLVSSLNGNWDVFEIDKLQNCIRDDTLKIAAPIMRIISYHREFGILIQLSKAIFHLVKDQTNDLKFNDEIISSYYKSEHLLTIQKTGKITQSRIDNNPSNNENDYKCSFCGFIEDKNIIYCVEKRHKRIGEMMSDMQTIIKTFNDTPLKLILNKAYELYCSHFFHIRSQNLFLLYSDEKISIIDIIDNRLIKTIEIEDPLTKITEYEKFNIILTHSVFGDIKAWSLDGFQPIWSNSLKLDSDENYLNNSFLDHSKGIYYIKEEFGEWNAINIRNGELLEDKIYIPPQGFEILSSGELNIFQNNEWESKKTINLGVGKITNYWLVENGILFVQKNVGELYRIDIKDLTYTLILNNLNSDTNPVFLEKRILFISIYNWLEIYDLETNTCEPQKYLTSSVKSVKYNQQSKTIAIVNKDDRLEILKMLS
ncbi:MAG: hypothetical protein K8R73_12630, partial [Clostridiales bacterium]|nr:hypothetical protein [Clostridiales bacterium]